MTDKPFGVNLTFLPAVKPPDYPGYMRAIIDGGVKIVETAGSNPQQVLPALKEAGIKVIHKCTSVRHSLKAERIGCDAISVDGFECGGHPGRGRRAEHDPAAPRGRGTEDPVRGLRRHGRRPLLVAALAMGADGMNMGTRFIATKEAPVHENVKQAHRRRHRTGHPADHALAAQHRARAEQRRGRAPAGQGARAGREPQVRGHHRGGRGRLSAGHAARARWTPAPGAAAWSRA